MDRRTSRRKLLGTVGAATIGFDTASIVSADKNGGTDHDGLYRLPDLSIRSFLEENIEVEITIEEERSNGPIATSKLDISGVQQARHSDSRHFSFEIPQGRYRLLVASEGNVFEEETFAAPIGGYPEHRGFVARFDRDSFDLFEQYI